MNAINFGQSVSMATEAVVSLRGGFEVFRSWYKGTVPLSPDSDAFRRTWGYCHELQTEEIFKKRVSEFAETLKTLRITSILPCALSGDEFEVTRNIIFRLGDEKNSCVVELVIQLSKEDEDTLDKPNPWVNWELSYSAGIVCNKHPDKKFSKVVILGADAVAPTQNDLMGCLL